MSLLNHPSHRLPNLLLALYKCVLERGPLSRDRLFAVVGPPSVTDQKSPMPENAFSVCADLARRHGPKLGVRTLDSLHVACALELKAERFWTFDDRQAKLAKSQGLKTT